MKPEEKKKEIEGQIRAVIRSAFELGGLDSLREMEALFAREAAKIRQRERKGTLSEEVSLGEINREKYKEIIASSPAMLGIFHLIDKVAPSSVTVLIQGESGTGKELIARSIHKNSPRKNEEFVAENCAAIPETLLESELFGYKRGAFTGAEKNKRGLFEVAHGGTLFLDEIGDMSINMQKKLLRALQDGEIRPVGGNETIHVDVRLISASNKNLQKMVAQRLFREDLFYRLNTFTITLPPLRERREDIPLLVDYLLDKLSIEMNVKPGKISGRALQALSQYWWPGNIRELENEIRRCLALKGGEGEVDLNDLSDEVKNSY